jgi:hypothetical protein
MTCALEACRSDRIESPLLLQRETPKSIKIIEKLKSSPRRCFTESGGGVIN